MIAEIDRLRHELAESTVTAERQRLLRELWKQRRDSEQRESSEQHAERQPIAFVAN